MISSIHWHKVLFHACISITESAINVVGLESYNDSVSEWLQESVGGVVNLDMWKEETKILWML